LSSILDALKKLERESSRGDDRPGWPDIVSTKKKSSGSPGITRPRVYIILLVVAGLMVGGGIFFLGKGKDPGLQEDRFKSTPPDTQKQAVILPRQDAPVDSDRTRPDTDAPGKKSTPVPDAKKNLPHPARSAASDGVRQTIRPPVISKKDILSEKKPKSLSSTPAAPGGKNQPLPLEPFADPRIDLQAIAWSPTPEDCFVVINNEILRKGENIDGIKIIAINKDSVSFQEGRKSWRQEFTIR